MYLSQLERDNIHTVPAPIDIEQTVFTTLDGGQVSFLEYQLPTLGMTLALQVQEGSVVLYASNKIRNPNAAFHDYRLETSLSADVYINASVFEEGRPRVVMGSGNKRQVAPAEFTNITVFVTLEGLGDTNTFELDTTVGDSKYILFLQQFRYCTTLHTHCTTLYTSYHRVLHS